MKSSNKISPASYLRKIGYEKIEDLEKKEIYLQKNLNSVVLEALERYINERAHGNKHDNLFFYNFKNKDLKRSIVISCANEYDFDLKLCQWICDHRKLFHGRILEIGCDCGVFSSFLGLNFPDLQIVSIDVCEKAVNNAGELAKKMGVTNVEFRCIALRDLDETFDTVFSSKVAHENFEHFGPVSLHHPLAELTDFCKKRLEDYAAQLRNHLIENGTLISIERIGLNCLLSGWMYALNSQNFKIINPSSGILEFTEYGDTVNQFACIVSESSGTVPQEQLDKYYLSFFDHDKSSQELSAFFCKYVENEIAEQDIAFNWFASARLHVWKKELIEGYYGCDKNNEEDYKFAIWSNKHSENTFLLEILDDENGYHLKQLPMSILQNVKDDLQQKIRELSSPQISFYRFHNQDGKEVREKEPIEKSDS